MTSMDHPLPDVWFTRDLPVLRAIARLVDEGEHGGSPYLLGAVVPASGLPKADVVAAAKALAGAGYVEVLTNHAGEIVRCTGHLTGGAAAGRALADAAGGVGPAAGAVDGPGRARAHGRRAAAVAGDGRRGHGDRAGRRRAAHVLAGRRLRAPAPLS